MPVARVERAADFFDLSVEGQSLRLHHDRYAEWREEKTLFIADVHLGKIAHFRRAGFNLPNEAGDETFARLTRVIETVRPQRLIILGDLFHSEFNQDFNLFSGWRQQFPLTDIWLIPGNHDAAGKHHLYSLGIKIEKPGSIGPFYLRHEPGETENGFLLCGHLHPSVAISGSGRQHIRMPAFWYCSRFLCLPAFGAFTGNAVVKPEMEDVFFAVTGNKLHRIPACIL